MANYFMLGGDGQEYGPVGAEQVRQWLAEGRANAQTQLRDAAGGGWMPLGAVPEFNGPAASAQPGPAAYASSSLGSAFFGGAPQNAGVNTASPVSQRLANTLGAGSGWMKFVAVMMFIGGGFCVLTIWGVIIAWVPIWLGAVLWGAASKADAARRSGTPADLHKSLDGFRFYYMLSGILGIVSFFLIIPLVGLLAAMAIPAFAKVREVARQKAVTNNLRMLDSAAQSYMLDNGVTHASYSDLVGPGTDKEIRSITSVAGEDYSDLVISQGDTQITISGEAFGTVTFDE